MTIDKNVVYLKEMNELSTIHCPHEPKDYTIILNDNNPRVRFMCCNDCYDRLLGFFVTQITNFTLKVR
jgi:hypothetical protein